MRLEIINHVAKGGYPRLTKTLTVFVYFKHWEYICFVKCFVIPNLMNDQLLSALFIYSCISQIITIVIFYT